MAKKNDTQTKIISLPPKQTEEEVVIVEPTIHDKYRKYIESAKLGYVNGLDRFEIMEILRWTEKKANCTLPINTSCSSCVMDLIRLFSNLENK